MMIEFILLFIQLMSIEYLPISATILRAENVAVNETKALHSWTLYFDGEERQ